MVNAAAHWHKKVEKKTCQNVNNKKIWKQKLIKNVI